MRTPAEILDAIFSLGEISLNPSKKLPDSWDITKIKYALEDTYSGATPSKSNDDYWADDGVPWVKISDMSGVSRVTTTDEHITGSALEETQLQIIPKGTLLLSMYASLGETAILNVNATTNQAILALQPNEDICSRDYLKYYIEATKPYLPGFSMSNTQDNLSSEKIRDLPLILPPLETQEKIVEYIDKRVSSIEEINSESRRSIELLHEKRHKIISDFVTSGVNTQKETKKSGEDWVGEIPVSWDVARTRFVADLESGHTPSKSKDEYWVDCNIPWVTTSDIDDFRTGKKVYLNDTEYKINELGLENSGARLLPQGTVFLSRTASVGFSGIMGKEMATSQDFANWVCGEKIIPEYLLYVFRSMTQEFERLMQGSTHQTIYMPDIRSFKTPLPPKEQQRKIIEHIEREREAIWELIDRLEEIISLLQEKRHALIIATVTGQIDVTTD